MLLDQMSRALYLLLVSLVALSVSAVYADNSLIVTATAYAVKGRTHLGAWGDALTPEVKSIAVSHDLIHLKLTHGTLVKIEGLDGRFLVMDKMAKRWKRRIDIYMGTDVKSAKTWGKRKVKIQWSAPTKK